MKRLALIAFAFAAGIAQAEVKPFETGSLAKIRAAREGRPFILSFWSLDCAHCPKELQALGELRKRHPRLDVVLVSTDSPAITTALADFSRQQGLGQSEQWVFADGQAQKLRYEIDRRWWGELPRTYFYDAGHRIEAVSGVVPDDVLSRWAQEHAR